MISDKDLTDEQKAVLFIVNKLAEKFSVDKLYIQKVVFLMSKILPDIVTIYEYEPYKFGMFSSEVELIIRREQDLNLMKDLNITETGKEVVASISKTEEMQQINQVFADIAGLGKEDILYLLYKLYPEFTTKSTIKERVDSYKLQSATIPTGHLKDGQDMTIKTDKGNFIKVKKENGVIKILEYGESEYGQN